MLSLTQIGLFTVASIALIFTPGPDIIYVVTRGMAQGRKAAIAAAAGFGLGNFVHTLFAVLGLSALLMASATAFQIVKWAGAAYLIYLGIQMIRHASSTGLSAGMAPMSGWAVFRQSIVANILNPKVAIFFLAFFPQFVDADLGHPRLQMAVLGTLFVGLVLVCFTTVGLCSGWIGTWLRKNARAEARMGRIAGSVLILLGLSLLWPRKA
jgi:threonine/homoserine/homoserine lactone efflux protein